MERVTHVRKLYKAILRLHRSLPVELGALGNEYVREEFKRHKKCNDAEAMVFLNEWTDYAVSLRNQFSTKNMNPYTGSHNIGKSLQLEQLDSLRDEQVAQLYELMKASKGEKDSEAS